jgi:hypothetical protein
VVFNSATIKTTSDSAETTNSMRIICDPQPYRRPSLTASRSRMRKLAMLNTPRASKGLERSSWVFGMVKKTMAALSSPTGTLT